MKDSASTRPPKTEPRDDPPINAVLWILTFIQLKPGDPG
jgi:hypothetical protein